MREARPLRVVYVDDNPSDVELIEHELCSAGFAPTGERVETEYAFTAALNTGPEVILCDYQMPGFDALLAIDILSERSSHVPLIIVSGTIGEEVAVEAMRRGAADYLLKDRLARLGSAVERALERSRSEEERRRNEHSLREAETRYRSLVEKTPAIVYTWAATTGVVSFNGLYVSPQIERILGFAPDEWLADTSLWIDRLHPEDRDRVVEETDRCVRERIPFRLEYRMIARDGRTVWLLDEAIPLSEDGPGGPVLFQGVQIDITSEKDAEDERKRSLEQIRILEHQRRDLLARIVTIQEEERRRIAADIHDDALQKFSALGLRLESLGRMYPEIQQDERYPAILKGISDSASRLRHLIFELHPHVLESTGFMSALRGHLAELEEMEPSPTYEIYGELDHDPSRKTRAMLYRITQEGVSNARKHAGASRVIVRLEEKEGGFFVRIEDDGIGFDPLKLEAVPPHHLGLTSMRERAELAGGWLRIESEPGIGTTVKVWLPDE
jgi:two-component system, NarL family, sensor histidine kinase UhpB